MEKLGAGKKWVSPLILKIMAISNPAKNYVFKSRKEKKEMMAIGIGLMIALMVGCFAAGGLLLHHEDGKYQEQHHQVAQEKPYEEPVKSPPKIYPVPERRDIGP